MWVRAMSQQLNGCVGREYVRGRCAFSGFFSLYFAPDRRSVVRKLDRHLLFSAANERGLEISAAIRKRQHVIFVSRPAFRQASRFAERAERMGVPHTGERERHAGHPHHSQRAARIFSADRNCGGKALKQSAGRRS